MRYNKYKKSLLKAISDYEADKKTNLSTLKEMSELTREFLEDAGKAEEVIQLVESGLTLEGLNETEGLSDIDYDRVFGDYIRARFYLWSASETGSTKLAEKGVNKMISFLENGRFTQETIRQFKEDLSLLDGILEEKGGLVSNLEVIEEEVRDAKKQKIQDKLTRYEEV